MTDSPRFAPVRNLEYYWRRLTKYVKISPTYWRYRKAIVKALSNGPMTDAALMRAVNAEDAIPYYFDALHALVVSGRIEAETDHEKAWAYQKELIAALLRTLQDSNVPFNFDMDSHAYTTYSLRNPK